jgi:hypothetical protein
MRSIFPEYVAIASRRRTIRRSMVLRAGAAWGSSAAAATYLALRRAGARLTTKIYFPMQQALLGGLQFAGCTFEIYHEIKRFVSTWSLVALSRGS